MRRREFITFLGSAVAQLLPRIALAQERGRTYRLGFVVQTPFSRHTELFDELKRNGFVQGANLSVDAQGFSVPIEQMDTVASAVVKAGPDAIFCGGDAASRAVQSATTTIPIVTLTDDVTRLVSSLARPGGNITGVSIFAPELDGKRLEILIEMIPTLRHVATLTDPQTTTSEQLQTLQVAARSRGIELAIYRAAAPDEIPPAIDKATSGGAEALNVLASALFNANHLMMIERIASARLPAMYQWPDYIRDGALVAYGPRRTSLLRQSAGQIVQVLKGTKPAEIPAQQPTTFELAINLKTAKALGLIVPPSLLTRADEVIE